MDKDALSNGIDNIEAELVEEDVVKEESKASTVKFRESTYATINTKYADWKRQNESPRQVKSEINSAVREFTNATDEAEKMEIAQHISDLMSKYKFLKVNIPDSTALVGERAIKLNDEMNKNFRENCKAVYREIDNEMVGFKKTDATPLSDEEMKEFTQDIANEESGVEEVSAEPEATVEEPVESESIVEENVEQSEPEKVEAPVTEPIDETEVEYTKDEMISPEASQDLPVENQAEDESGMSDEEIAERQKELNLDNLTFENRPSAEVVPAESEVALIPEKIAPEDSISEEPKEEPTEEEIDEPVADEDVTIATEDTVNMDVNEVAAKKQALNGKIMEDFEELSNRRNKTLEESHTMDDNLAEAREKLKTKQEEIDRKTNEKNAKLADLERLSEALKEEIAKIEEENANKQKEIDTISEETQQLDVEDKQLDSDIASLDSLLELANENNEKSGEPKTK
ncbi:MAG: hypothetical protein IJI43_04595 [Bacilli bacterium]|nr:hypothetical protein [Bacilli bacterium]